LIPFALPLPGFLIKIRQGFRLAANAWEPILLLGMVLFFECPEGIGNWTTSYLKVGIEADACAASCQLQQYFWVILSRL
jgi:hypothetical protein